MRWLCIGLLGLRLEQPGDIKVFIAERPALLLTDTGRESCVFINLEMLIWNCEGRSLAKSRHETEISLYDSDVVVVIWVREFRCDVGRWGMHPPPFRSSPAPKDISST